MSLSEQEQRALREIERSLLADDPTFGASVAADSTFSGGRGSVTLRGVAIAVVGLILLIAGVALAQVSFWFIALSIAGFLVMLGAGVWMLRTPSSEGRGEAESKRGGRQSRDGAAPSKLEENFRRRFEDNQ